MKRDRLLAFFDGLVASGKRMKAGEIAKHLEMSVSYVIHTLSRLRGPAYRAMGDAAAHPRWAGSFSRLYQQVWHEALRQGYNLRGLARASGVPYPTLRDWVLEAAELGTPNLKKILKCLNLELTVEGRDSVRPIEVGDRYRPPHMGS